MLLEIQLSHFDGYFHLFAALNLAYAGWETFRSALDNRVLNISKRVQPSIKNEIELLKSKLIILQAEQNPLYNKMEKLNNESSQKLEIISSAIDKKTIAEGLSKSIFLFTGLYCVALLILAGYEQFFSSMVTACNTLLILHFSAVYNIILFYKSCRHKYVHQAVTPLIPLILISTALLVATLYCMKCPMSDRYSNIISVPTNIGIAIFIAASPYLLYIARVYQGKFYFWWQFKRVEFHTKYRLERLNYVIDFTYDGATRPLSLRMFLFLYRYLFFKSNSFSAK